MVNLDWERIRSRPPDDFSDDEKDELFNSVTWYIPEPNLDVEHFKILLSTAQTILKYKGEQVESLVGELDELAAKQGAEEARHQSLLEELEDMRILLARTRKKGKTSRRDSEAETLRNELVQSEESVEKLRMELKAREKDLLDEKRDVEKLTGQVLTLESEKTELRRELASIQVESNSYHDYMENNDMSTSKFLEQQKEMSDSIKQKNKHISQLLSDIEVVEKENKILRKKLSSIRDKLSEATKSITYMSGKITSLKFTCEEQREKLNLSEEQNAALRSQIKELVDQKLYRDSQLDDFSEALDSRVQSLQKLMEEKDAEVRQLKSKLSNLASQTPNIQIDSNRSHVTLLKLTLQEREELVETLRLELSDATKELLNCTTLIEKLRAKKSRAKNIDLTIKLQSQLQEAETQVKFLESKLKDAEEDAQAKAEEMTGMIIQLRDYESGEYGLTEAVKEIKELKKQCKIRDKQIEELVQATNTLYFEAGNLDEQNSAFREKLGLPPDATVSVSSVKSRRQKEKALIQSLERETEQLKEDKLQLQLDTRKLTQQINKLTNQVRSLGYEPDLVLEKEVQSHALLQKQTSDEVVPYIGKELSKEQLEIATHQFENLQEKFQDALKENEALRKGMHEILDSIRNQDGSSAVQLKSECLERLLEALDSRHISGWYHPAMRMQNQLSTVEGSNEVLREQLREAKLEEKKVSQQLQMANVEIEKLKHSLSGLQNSKKSDAYKGLCYEEIGLPPNMTLSSAEIIDKLNTHLLHVLNQYNNETERNNVLMKDIEELNGNYNILHHQMGLLYKQYSAEKSNSGKLHNKLKSENMNLKHHCESLETKVKEFENHWNVLNKDENEQKRLLSESAQRTATSRANEIVITRKCETLQQIESQLRKEHSTMTEMLSEIECNVTKQIGELTRHKEMSSVHISSLQKMLEDSVPLTVLDAANKQYDDLTAKYRDMLQKEQQIIFGDQLVAARLEGEADILRKEKIEMSNALQEALEKLHSMEIIMNSANQDTVTQDTHDNQIAVLMKKIAQIEVSELNEKQKADHAQKMCDMMKEQLTQLEKRNIEVENQNEKMLQQNIELQQVEFQLREKLITAVTREELQELQKKLQESETRNLELNLEKEKLQELTDIAQDQVKTLELWKSSHDLGVQSLRQVVMDMHSISEDKATIARMSYELLSLHLGEASRNQKIQQLEKEVKKLQASNLHQEIKLDKKDKDIAHLRSQFTNRYRTLHQVIQNLRRHYSGAVPLAKFEGISTSLCQLKKEKEEAQVKLEEAEHRVHDTLAKNRKLEEELKCLKEFKQTLQISDPKQDMDWYTKNTELRLNELQSRNKAEFSEQQLKRAEERIIKLESHIATLEEEHIQDKQHLEQTLEHGEGIQMELCKQLEECKVKEKSLQIVQTSNVSSEDNKLQVDLNRTLNLVSTQSQSLLKCEAEVAQLRSQVTFLSQQLENKDKILSAKQKVSVELHKQVDAPLPAQDASVPQITQAPVDTTEKLVLKATIESLETIIKQKEEAIARYQVLLQESRDEHSKAAVEAIKELSNLQEAMAQQQQEYRQLKSKLSQPAFMNRHTISAVEQYIKRMHELEGDVKELRTTIANQNNQLHSCRGEAEQWRTLAEERLHSMEKLHHRLQDEHRKELLTYQESVIKYQEQAQTAIQESTRIREQLQQKSHPSPTSLKNQLIEKDEKIELLSKTVSTLKQELSLFSTFKGDNFDYQSMQRSSSVDDMFTLRRQLFSANAKLKSAKNDIHKLQQKSRELWLKKKREARAEREEFLLNKINVMEKEFKEEKEKMENEFLNREFKKIKSAEEVAKWNEKKHWQQTVEKMKQRIKENTLRTEQLVKTEKALRETISRLEREKFVLTSRRTKGSENLNSHIEGLKAENMKLLDEIASLQSKVDENEHHFQGVNVGMLEKRLETQQRRIAVLELSKKGDAVVAEQLEKLHEANTILQNANLRLETENLELQLELQKTQTDTPHLQEKISHLENYITLLKAESSTGSSETDDAKEVAGKKSYARLEKTIIVLKKVIEKLQNENKRLLGVKQNVDREHNKVPLEHHKIVKLEAENRKLQEEYLDAIKRETQLREEVDQMGLDLKELERKMVSTANESDVLKTQLVQKNQLLNRVKTLLQRAAAKEKMLHDQVIALKSLLPTSAVKD